MASHGKQLICIAVKTERLQKKHSPQISQTCFEAEKVIAL